MCSVKPVVPVTLTPLVMLPVNLILAVFYAAKFNVLNAEVQMCIDQYYCYRTGVHSVRNTVTILIYGFLYCRVMFYLIRVLMSVIVFVSVHSPTVIVMTHWPVFWRQLPTLLDWYR